MADNTTPTYRPGDRVRTLPEDGDIPAGTLGTITEHYPTRPAFPEGYGIRLDTDPTGLSAHYYAHEIEPAPTPADTDLREAVANAVYRHMPTAAEQPATTAYLILTGVLEVVDGLERQRAALDADRARVLQIVADWAHSSSEYGGLDHGDLIHDLEHAGYHLPTPTSEETDRG